MGRPKRLYPLGKYRLRTPKVVDKEKAYPVELEYRYLPNIMKNILIRLLLMSYPVFSRTSLLHVVTKEKISWSLHWNVFLRTMQETESEEAGMKTERAA